SMTLDGNNQDMERLNQKLACIDSADTSLEMTALLNEEASLKKSGHTYVFISKNREENLIQSLRALAGTGNTLLWVLPIRAADSPSLLPFRDLHVTRILWEI
ncbi:MAG: hypothetical protein NC400_14735, partial [Clostridium sp.]|nr:hypothetical protein [Clostridium sp.]